MTTEKRKVREGRRALSCPECGVDALIPAHGRGRVSRDGNEVAHSDACRCRWCDWMWWDDAPPVTCACGAVVRVVVDDGYAYAQAVSP
jgi:hypothetical protein